jgi:sarcosine oxidase
VHRGRRALTPAAGGAIDVIVAGLGAMGSAAAWQLASRGLRVVGLDRYHPPHTLGSSHGGSRVIREMAFEHPRYVPLVRRAYELWAELEAAPGRVLRIPTGALYLGAPSSSVVSGSRASAVEHGIPSEELDAAAVRARWPQFRPDPGMVGLLEHRAGVLRPEACVEAMLAAAARSGATLHFDEPLTGWVVEPGGGVVVRTGRAEYRAQRLVLALGPWMREELARVGTSVWVERVVQHWFTPADPALMDPSRCPIYLWESDEGVIFYGFPMLDGVVKAAVHHRGESVTADTVRREVTPQEVARAQEYLARWMPAANGAYRRSAVCLYTNAADGDFVLDRHPEHRQVLLASPCAGIGFKFAPVVGEIVADLVQDRESRFDLAPFAIGRFSSPSGAPSSRE